MMQMKTTSEFLADYVVKQTNTIFPDPNNNAVASVVRTYVPQMLEDIEYCFSHINDKYCNDGKHIMFDHFNSNHYTMFLYKLAHNIWKETKETQTPTALFMLNKSLSAIDLYYEVELPRIFYLNHTSGSVLGRAKYSDYFFASQQCTVGSNKGKYPTIGKYVSLHPGSRVIGNCNIKDNCKISAHSIIMDIDVPTDTVYIGNTLHHCFKTSKTKYRVWR